MSDNPQSSGPPKQGPAPQGQPGPAPQRPGPAPQGGQPQRGPGNPPPQGGPNGPKVLPLADAAFMRPRHWGLLLSFLISVMFPVLLGAWYLFAVAEDRYVSVAGFTVRQEDSASSADLLGGLARMTGASVSGDSHILYQFIRSPELVSRLNEEMDLISIYSEHWRDDPLFSLWPSATVEDLLWYWKRVVSVSLDQSSGLIEVKVIGLEPEEAKNILEAVVRESEKLINNLSVKARADAMRYADADLATALERLRTARAALTQFRSRTQLVDPESDLQVRMGVLANLQQQLAAALVEFDVLVQGVANANRDPRVRQAQRRIEVIRNRITEERSSFSSAEYGDGDADYPTLMAEYESLMVDRQYAEETYRMALAASDASRANAARETRYLATYIEPTLPERSEYPQRWLMLGVLALALGMFWAIGALIFYSVRDRQ